MHSLYVLRWGDVSSDHKVVGQQINNDTAAHTMTASTFSQLFQLFFSTFFAIAINSRIVRAPWFIYYCEMWGLFILVRLLGVRKKIVCRLPLRAIPNLQTIIATPGSTLPAVFWIFIFGGHIQPKGEMETFYSQLGIIFHRLSFLHWSTQWPHCYFFSPFPTGRMRFVIFIAYFKFCLSAKFTLFYVDLIFSAHVCEFA